MLRKLIDQVFHIEPGVGMINDVSLTAQIEINSYIRSQLEECLARPRDDMLTDLSVAEIDEGGVTRALTVAEAADFANLLISAGTETVARLLGWASVILAEHPDQRGGAGSRRITPAQRGRGAVALRGSLAGAGAVDDARGRVAR